MIFYFKPFSTAGSLFSAYKESAALVKNPEDWVCFLDGDTMFLNKNWGNNIEAYVRKYPNAGLFTCYASRCSYERQVPKIGDQKKTDLLFHISVQKKLEQHQGPLAVKKIEDRIAGHLMLIKKETWDLIEPIVEARVTQKNKKILGVDTAISRAILEKGKEILLMRSIYLVHLFRLDGRRY